jgi:hypothetical protein
MAKIENPLNSRHVEHNNGQDRDIARRGSVAKRCNDPIAVHPGMTSLQRGGAGIGGMGHSVAAIADGGQTIASSAAASPLSHAYGDAGDLKSGMPAASPARGMRSRINADTETLADKVQYGKDCIATAVKN